MTMYSVENYHQLCRSPRLTELFSIFQLIDLVLQPVTLLFWFTLSAFLEAILR